MPDDQVLSTVRPFCPFLPPLVTPGKIQGQVDYRPTPCLGKHDPIKGGGCAAFALCQEMPESLRLLKNVAGLIESGGAG